MVRWPASAGSQAMCASVAALIDPSPWTKTRAGSRPSMSIQRTCDSRSSNVVSGIAPHRRRLATARGTIAPNGTAGGIDGGDARRPRGTFPLRPGEVAIPRRAGRPSPDGRARPDGSGRSRTSSATSAPGGAAMSRGWRRRREASHGRRTRGRTRWRETTRSTTGSGSAIAIGRSRISSGSTTNPSTGWPARSPRCRTTRSWVRPTRPGYYRWRDAEGELQSDFFNHLDVHLADVEAC